MLNILSGQDKANVKSFPIADGVLLEQGDWVIFNDGALEKQTGTYDKISQGAVFPVYAGNISFYDTRKLNRADVVTSKAVVLESDKVAAEGITAGAAVTIVDGVVSTTGVTADNVIGYAIKDQDGKGVLQFILE